MELVPEYLKVILWSVLALLEGTARYVGQFLPPGPTPLAPCAQTKSEEERYRTFHLGASSVKITKFNNIFKDSIKKKYGHK